MNRYYNINDDHLREVLRVKNNIVNPMDTPVNQPTSVKTVVATEKPSIAEWFEHVNKSLRERDKFGNLIIK